jgi:LuxR family transcriptional regulator, maltose regulon positive regulatory protein
MMGQTVATQQEDLRTLAATLLEQAEHCALAGLLKQAEAILDQVWTISEEQAPDIASAAAWEMAWLLVRREAYIEAIDWFRRIVEPQPRASRLWPTDQQALIQICLKLAEQRSEPPVLGESPLSDMPALKVVNLGRFQIHRGGTILPPCNTHRAIALFRYLLTRPERSARKEELMELLWPTSSPREAANSLYVAVNSLRRYLDLPNSSYLLCKDGCYAINPYVVVEDDCAAFQQLVDAGDQHWHAKNLVRAERAYSDALAYYQGDYYVDNRDPTWAITLQAQLLTRYLTALDHLGQILISQGRLEQATRCYQRLLECDCYREDAHYQLMYCYWQLNRRSDALRQYGSCVKILANDLGLEPMKEIAALYATISKQPRSGGDSHDYSNCHKG